MKDWSFTAPPPPPPLSTQRPSLQSEDGEITGVITGRSSPDRLFIVGYGCAPCHIRYVRSPWGKVYSCCSGFLSPSYSTGTLQSKLYFLVDFQKVCFHESFPEMLQRDEQWGIRTTNKGCFILKVYSYIKDIRQQQIRRGYCSKSDIGRPFLVIGPLYCV